MKICVFSDIHGNSLAFEAAHRMLLKESADVNLFLGDLCGYYFDETEAWRRLLTVPRLIALRGNHDNMFVEAADGDISIQERYRADYGPSLELFLKKDHKDMVAWIRGLPLSNEEGKCRA
jgi:predicted phosphodiesterase